MDDSDEDLSGLTDLHKTIGGAAEVIAAFIGAGHSGEIPVDSLMQAAEQTLAELMKWHSGLNGLLAVADAKRH